MHTGDFPKWVKSKRRRKKKEKERERERKLVITMAKLRMAHASTHGARKPPGPKTEKYISELLFPFRSFIYFIHDILGHYQLFAIYLSISMKCLHYRGDPFSS